MTSDIEHISAYGMVRFAEFRLDDDLSAVLTITDSETAARAGAIYAWLIDEKIVRLGSCQSTLDRRMRDAAKWLQSRLRGTVRTTNEVRRRRELVDAQRWKIRLHRTQKFAEVWGRQGTMVPTPLGEINAYLSEENWLLKTLKPPLNNSHYR